MVVTNKYTIIQGCVKTWWIWCCIWTAVSLCLIVRQSFKILLQAVLMDCLCIPQSMSQTLTYACYQISLCLYLIGSMHSRVKSCTHNVFTSYCCSLSLSTAGPVPISTCTQHFNKFAVHHYPSTPTLIIPSTSLPSYPQYCTVQQQLETRM